MKLIPNITPTKAARSGGPEYMAAASPKASTIVAHPQKTMDPLPAFICPLSQTYSLCAALLTVNHVEADRLDAPPGQPIDCGEALLEPRP